MRDKWVVGKFNFTIISTLIRNKNDLNFWVVNMRVSSVECMLCGRSARLTLCDPIRLCPLGSSVHRISQARILEWVAISFSRGPSRPRDQTHVSWFPALAGWFFTTEPPGKSERYKVIGEFISVKHDGSLKLQYFISIDPWECKKKISFECISFLAAAYISASHPLGFWFLGIGECLQKKNRVVYQIHSVLPFSENLTHLCRCLGSSLITWNKLF